MLVKINEERCKTCGLCINYCPKGVLAVGDNTNSKGYRPVAVQDQPACIGCLACALICPDDAIEVYKED